MAEVVAQLVDLRIPFVQSHARVITVSLDLPARGASMTEKKTESTVPSPTPRGGTGGPGSLEASGKDARR